MNFAGNIATKTDTAISAESSGSSKETAIPATVIVKSKGNFAGSIERAIRAV